MLKKLFLNDNIILGLIIANSVVIFLLGYYPDESNQALLTILDNTITALFIVEMVVKLIELGAKGYFAQGWNRFDFILVALSVPALLAFIFGLNLADFSFLLVFRVLRVFKAFRFFRFIPDIDKLFAGLKRAMKTSVFVLAGFVIYIFVVGILSYNLFTGSGSEMFADPLISLYSTFKVFTIEGWNEIPESIALSSNGISAFWVYFYFVFIVLTGGIFGLSIVNSIFVDTMVSDNNDELEEKIDKLDEKVTEILEKISTNETRKNS